MNNLKRYTLYILNMVDLLALLLAYIPAYVVRFDIIAIFYPQLARADFSFGVYWRFLLIVIVGYVIFNILFLYNDEKYLARSGRQEIAASLKMTFYVMAFVTIDLYAMQAGEAYSRLFVGIYAIFVFLIDVGLRILIRKKVLPKLKRSNIAEEIIIIGNEDDIQSVVKRISSSEDWRYSIKGLVVLDHDLTGEDINGIPVISSGHSLYADLEKADADGIMVIQDRHTTDDRLQLQAEQLTHLGKKIHLYEKELKLDAYRYQDDIGGCPVLTYEMYKPMPRRQVFLRRFISFLTGLLLLPGFIIFYILTWLFTMHSKGPVLIRRVRVGINGRRYFQYRFRVMRMDSEKRLEDRKSPYMWWGRVLLFLHADGLPEVLDLILGDMDIVGWESPSLPEFLRMDPQERNLLAIRPGIIGYWSVSKNKEKNVDSMQRYIKRWNLGKDILILFGTFFRYIGFHSLRTITTSGRNEELAFIHEENEENKPLVYDHSYYQKELGFSDYVYLFVKRLLDIILSLLAIIVLSPLLLALTAAVVLGDGGTPFYGHRRVGKNGRKITIWKFRSMRTDAGDLQKLLTKEQLEQYSHEFKIDNDPRITKLGTFIRRTSLDELPQLFNILAGDLSFVGPRPIVVEETEIYGKEIAKLLSVKPGLTGYWQAYARNKATYESGERQAMEMYYVDHASLRLDIRIVFKTFSTVLKKEGAQ